MIYFDTTPSGSALEDAAIAYIHSVWDGTGYIGVSWFHDFGSATTSFAGHPFVAPQFGFCDGTAVPVFGVTATLAPGMTVQGGIITSAGSGSFLADPGDGLAGGTYP
jgi:hypothetical protein